MTLNPCMLTLLPTSWHVLFGAGFVGVLFEDGGTARLAPRLSRISASVASGVSIQTINTIFVYRYTLETSSGNRHEEQGSCYRF